MCGLSLSVCVFTFSLAHLSCDVFRGSFLQFIVGRGGVSLSATVERHPRVDADGQRLVVSSRLVSSRLGLLLRLSCIYLYSSPCMCLACNQSVVLGQWRAMAEGLFLRLIVGWAGRRGLSGLRVLSVPPPFASLVKQHSNKAY